MCQKCLFDAINWTDLNKSFIPKSWNPWQFNWLLYNSREKQKIESFCSFKWVLAFYACFSKRANGMLIFLIPIKLDVHDISWLFVLVKWSAVIVCMNRLTIFCRTDILIPCTILESFIRDARSKVSSKCQR